MKEEDLKKEINIVQKGYYNKFSQETGRVYNFKGNFKSDLEYITEFNKWLLQEKRDEKLRQLGL